MEVVFVPVAVGSVTGVSVGVGVTAGVGVGVTATVGVGVGGLGVAVGVMPTVGLGAGTGALPGLPVEEGVVTVGETTGVADVLLAARIMARVAKWLVVRSWAMRRWRPGFQAGPVPRVNARVKAP